MGSSSFHGTPCLVPAEFKLNDGVTRRGFITRLSHVAAALSSDPELEVGTQLTVSFKRPSDGHPIEARAGVREHLSEGGLWRGRPAALVAFHSPVELEEGEGVPTVEPLPSVTPPPQALADLPDGVEPEPFSEPPPYEDDEPLTEEQPAVKALGRALRGKGLGKRKLAGRLRRTASLSEDDGSTTGQLDSVPAHVSELSSAFFDEDDATAPPPRSTEPDSEDDVTQLPGQDGFDDFFSERDPAGLPSDDGMRAFDAPARDLSEDDAFIEHFGRPEGVSLDMAGVAEPVSRPPRALSEPGTLPPEYISPASFPEARVPHRPVTDIASSGEVPPVFRPAEASGPAPGGTVPAADRPMHASRAVPRASSPSTRPPWEEELSDRAVASLIPRNARIASTVDVTFWARGRKNAAMADNFSREGLFLTYPGTPPVRGAIVRIEFPLEGSDESVPVRFNAEVRWHRSDRPGVGLADGFGVQILTFETPRDRARYEELLDAILALGPASAPVEGFSWGRSGG